ncbi:MAG TPA: hypothetical protein VNA04_10430 [Thermoanaerobaculia bacterium]|nr:hypothetical protein [Thermoanaerobaculia bacterium]
MDRQSVRRHRFAFVFIALLVAVLFLPALVKREVFTLRDHTDYFQPLRYFTAIHLRAFVLPHWNPYSASGEPWLANPQTGVFYPPTWLFIPLPFETAYMAYLALHLAILGWGAYLLFARSVAAGAALAGAVAVTFAGPTLSLLDVSNNLASFAWVPLAMWAAMARASPHIAAVILAMAFLGGEPFFAAIAAALYAILRVVPNAGAARPPRFLAHARNDIALTAAGALGLSAIQLLPFLEMLRGSNRTAGLPAAEIFRESMAPRDWLRVAVPPRLGATAYDPALSQHFIPVIYVGMGVALFAVLAWIFVRRRAVLGWTALLLGAVVVAAGAHLPLGRLFEILPVMPFRYPSRVVPFGALALVALAVLAWDRFRPKQRWGDLVLVLVLLADLLPRAAPLLHTAPFRTEMAPYPAAAGRVAKIIRLHEEPVRDREAWIAGYANLYHRRFDASTPAPVVSARYGRLHDTAVAGGRHDLLAFLAAGFVLTGRAPADHLRPMATVRGVTMYSSPAPPMANLWTWWRPEKTAGEALEALLVRGMAAGIPVAGAGAAAIEAAAGRQIEVERLVIDTRSARAVVNAPEEGVLVLTQQDAPGWRVSVDGEEREKLLAGGVFRAVLVPPGRHEIVWRWKPSSLRAGMIVTILAALSLQTSAFVKRFRRRKFSS